MMSSVSGGLQTPGASIHLHFTKTFLLMCALLLRFFLTTSKDMTAKLYTLDPVEGYRPKTFAGHKDAVLAAYFSKDAETIYTVARDGAVYTWQSKDQPDSDESDQEQVEPAASTSSTTSLSHPSNRIAAIRWGVAEKNFFMRSGERVSSVCYHYASSLLIVGFSSGIFSLYQMPSFQQIHQLSISQEHITSVTINPTGEWLAFGASKLGQLLVWEWQTESYILKQQGHYYDMNCLAFSPDDGGQHIVTGGDDGKVKLWNASSGFCFVTFSEHSAPVTAVEFAKQGSVIFSASLDGTVRAFDLVRYRNFRTFQPPQPVQFNSLAVDPSGEIVCAAGNGAASEGFEIYVWSTQTGKIVEVLTGHEGPVSALSFSPGGDRLASASWDATVRTWELYGRKSGASEAMSVGGADGLSVAWKPDGSHVAVSNLKGQILIFDVQDARQVGLIDGRRDISGGRKLDDRRTAANSESSKAFTSISYTADGSCILAGGNSRHVCLYDVQESTLLRKWEISQNLALEGTQDFLDSRRITKDGVALDLIDETGDASDLEDRLDRDKALPGARSGDLSKRKYRPEARTKSVRISPSGRSWAGASTEGLLVYSLDTMQQDTFDPFELDVEVTPDNVAGAVKDRQFLKALVMAFRLNEQPVIRTAYEAVPTQDIALLARQLPVVHAEAACRFVAGEMEKGSRHIQFNLEWVEALLSAHGRWLQQRSAEVAATMRSLQRGLTDCQNHISKVSALFFSALSQDEI